MAPRKRTPDRYSGLGVVGAYFGGPPRKRPPINSEQDQRNPRNFPLENAIGRPVQSIFSRPTPIARFNDPSNKAGYFSDADEMQYLKNFNMENLPDGTPIHSDTRTFLEKIDTVLMNPSYKQDQYEYQQGFASRKGTRSTADRMDKTLGDFQKKYRLLDESIQKMADANSVYFGKKFKVLKNPIQYEPESKGKMMDTFEGKKYQADRTLISNVRVDDDNMYRGYARDYSFGKDYDSVYRDPKKIVSDAGRRNIDQNKRTSVSATPYQDGFYMNNRAMLQDEQYGESRADVTKTGAYVAQHEFQHSIGVGHPKNYDESSYSYNPSQSSNTAMSYSNYGAHSNALLGPSDISFFQKAQKAINKNKKKK